METADSSELYQPPTNIYVLYTTSMFNKKTKQLSHMRRPRAGNLLALIIILTAVLVLLLLFGVSMGSLFLARYRVQNALDQVALTGACKLNSEDRIGQMNNMVARCRQLVYASRDTESEIAQKRPQLQKLAASLVDEARDSARDLEQETKTLLTVSTNEATKAMNDEFEKTCAQQTMALPWLKVSTPSLVSTRFGMVQGVDSNVSVLHGLPDLASLDREQSYTNKKPDLYVQGTNLRLPSVDSDLNFVLSSLPACVNNISAPARLVLPDVFRASPISRQLKSTVQVEAKVSISPASGQAYTMHFVSTATTYGAGPMP